MVGIARLFDREVIRILLEYKMHNGTATEVVVDTTTADDVDGKRW